MAEYNDQPNESVMAVARALREYGAAVRGDWSMLDGRSVRSDLERLALGLEEQSIDHDTLHWRKHLGICLTGGGHWHEHCEQGPNTWNCECVCDDAW